MMRLGNISRYAAPAFLVTASLGSLSIPALADTYTLYQIGVANSGYAGVAGINSRGQALYTNVNSQMYTVYDHGTVIAHSDNFPASFVPDNGSSCSIAYEGISYQGKCNNGYDAFGITGPYNSVPAINTFLIGHDGSFTALNFGSLPRLIFESDAIHLNSSGDVAFTVVGVEDSFQAYNTTPTPEPSSLLLLGTGVISATRLLRRRRQAGE